MPSRQAEYATELEQARTRPGPHTPNPRAPELVNPPGMQLIEHAIGAYWELVGVSLRTVTSTVTDHCMWT
jgi:hypothetical protein